MVVVVVVLLLLLLLLLLLRRSKAHEIGVISLFVQFGLIFLKRLLFKKAPLTSHSALQSLNNIHLRDEKKRFFSRYARKRLKIT